MKKLNLTIYIQSLKTLEWVYIVNIKGQDHRFWEIKTGGNGHFWDF